MFHAAADHDLLATLDAWGHPRLLVLGDLILDRYTWGDAQRVSQEAPVIVLRSDAREPRLGGAANVCHMLRGLEAKVTCAGIVGDDAAGRELGDLLAATGCDVSHLLTDPSRPTTVKERFIGRASNRHPHQMLRVDSEVCTPLGESLERELWQRLAPLIAQHQAVLISDYHKGVCTPWLLAQVAAAARQAGVPVLVDPIRGPDYARYRGVTAMTPNRLEAELATGIAIRTTGDAFRAGAQLCQQLNMPLAIITLDRDGMALVGPDGKGELFPTRARAVYDITGAGDMVLATVGLAWACGASPATACRMANVAAGLEVEKVGVAIVPRDELRQQLVQSPNGSERKQVEQEALPSIVHALRAQRRSIVVACGCFDLLHVGHIRFLEQAAALGDVLIVAVESDASVRRAKGPGRPVATQADRAALLAALAMVDYVVCCDEEAPVRLLEQIQPDVLAHGGNKATSDIAGQEFAGQEIVKAHGGRVCVIDRVEGYSTSELLASLRGEIAPPIVVQSPRRPPAPVAWRGGWPTHMGLSSLDY